MRACVAILASELLLAAVMAPAALSAAKLKAKAEPPAQDSIDIVANIPLAGGAVTKLTATQHHSRSYLYVEQASHVITLIDVTDAGHPAILSKVNAGAEAGSILTASGSAALVSTEEQQPPAKAKTMSIVSFADPAHPRTIRQFEGVTSSTVDERRGLILLANPDGLWILHRNPADDPEMQERYAHDVVYQ